MLPVWPDAVASLPTAVVFAGRERVRFGCERKSDSPSGSCLYLSFSLVTTPKV